MLRCALPAGKDEQVLGSFGVRKPNTWSADVQYRVVVSREPAVAVRVGGQLAGVSGPLLAHQLGLLGALVHEFFLAKRVARRSVEQAKALEQ